MPARRARLSAIAGGNFEKSGGGAAGCTGLGGTLTGARGGAASAAFIGGGGAGGGAKAAAGIGGGLGAGGGPLAGEASGGGGTPARCCGDADGGAPFAGVKAEAGSGHASPIVCAEAAGRCAGGIGGGGMGTAGRPCDGGGAVGGEGGGRMSPAAGGRAAPGMGGGTGIEAGINGVLSAGTFSSGGAPPAPLPLAAPLCAA